MIQSNELYLTRLNLTEVVVRAEDSFESLAEKTELATILGTLQSTLTYFPYLRKIWQKNTEEERLLGVSLTGQLDNALFAQQELDLNALKNVTIEVNKLMADALGIERSTAITTVKPSGTVSQLVNAASGIHARHSQYYIRSVRADNKDPLTQFLIESGVPHEPDVMKPNNTTVFYFPIKSPEGAITRNDWTAIEQLEYWKWVRTNWCEHNPSVTVTVREHEWVEVGNWVYKNFDSVCGISFLPHSDHVYRQAPYQECSEEEYNEALKKMPKEIRWDDLSYYEQEDNTSGIQTLSCTADSCEMVDLV